MPTPKKFGFIRTTLALWAADIGTFVRGGVVSDSPNGGNAWGINIPGIGWVYAAMRDLDERFNSVDSLTQIRQFGSERVESIQYSKPGLTALSGPTVETSVLTGLGSVDGWAAVTFPAGRLDLVGLLTQIKARGVVTGAGTSEITWRLRVNGAVVSTAVPTRSWGMWEIGGEAVTTYAGSGGARQWDIFLRANIGSGTADSLYSMAANAGIDLTAATTLDITVQCTAPGTAVTCTTAFVKNA